MHRRLFGWGAMLLLVWTLAACAGGGTSTPSRASAPPPNFQPGDLFVSVFQVKQELDRKADFDLIDVRSPDEFRKSYITGARNLPYYDVDKRSAEIPQDKWVVLY